MNITRDPALVTPVPWPRESLPPVLSPIADCPRWCSAVRRSARDTLTRGYSITRQAINDDTCGLLRRRSHWLMAEERQERLTLTGQQQITLAMRRRSVY
jgi:hypothetical protein